MRVAFVPPGRFHPPLDKAVPYLAACGRAYFTRAAFCILPSFAACLASRVLHKGKAKRGLGEERQLMLSSRVCVCWEEGGGVDFEPGLSGSR